MKINEKDINKLNLSHHDNKNKNKIDSREI